MMVVKIVVMIYCSIICQTAPNNEGCLVVIIIAIIVVFSLIIIKTITIISIIMIYCSTICQATPNEDCLVVVIGQGRDFLPLAPLRALSTGQCQ